MEIGLDSWRRNIRDLYESFQRTDAELTLLREIDRSIVSQLDGEKSVEDVFTGSLAQLARNYRLHEPGRCYVYVGAELLPLLTEKDGDGEVSVLNTPEAIERFAREPGSSAIVLARGEGEDDLFSQLSDANTVLLQPIYEANDQLFAVVLFADAELSQGSRLSDPELGESVQTVARQLSIAYTHFLRAEQEKRSRELWDLFIKSDLAPTRCFKLLAGMAGGIFPTFGPLRLEKKPEIQILVLEHAKDGTALFLTIRGTTGDEPVITKIKIDESISGLLVKKSVDELPFFCDDPRKEEYRGVYKSYLGQEAGTEIKTELAVRLVAPNGRLVGVLNIESGIENAFNIHHQAAILEFAERTARMVEVFEERIDHNRIMQLSVSSVTSKYLDSLAGIFRHGVASPLLAFKGDVEVARRILDEKIQPQLAALEGPSTEPSGSALTDGFGKLSEAIDALGEEYDQVREFTRDFGDEISGFGDTGRFDLRKLINETVSLAKRSYLTKAEEKIVITIEGAEPAYAFCSRLFKQHFFSLLTNAIYSLQERATDEPGNGEVKITIEPYTEANESQEVDLNRRWLVKVRDNGNGVDERTLAKVREFEPGGHYRKGTDGQGLGLVAMQRYMGSIGGWIKLDSKQGEFFEVSLLFDEYSDDIHGPLSILGKGGGDDS
jgi:signal transduction histidine kinase